jgi:hypothetical protein
MVLVTQTQLVISTFIWAIQQLIQHKGLRQLVRVKLSQIGHLMEDILFITSMVLFVVNLL